MTDPLFYTIEEWKFGDGSTCGAVVGYNTKNWDGEDLVHIEWTRTFQSQAAARRALRRMFITDQHILESTYTSESLKTTNVG